jgi:hypothetical protein
MTATASPREPAAHLERTSVLAMLVYYVFLAGVFCALMFTPRPSVERTSVLAMLVYYVFLAGVFCALMFTPRPSAGSSRAMLVVPSELTTDEAIGYR